VGELKTRAGKKSIAPEMSTTWYREFESGKTFKQIADDYGVDQRTVSSYVRREMEEIERQRARINVYQSVLKEHFDDLMIYLGTLIERINFKLPINTCGHDWEDLNQHLKSQRVNSKIQSWNDLLNLRTKTEGKIIERLQKTVRKDSALTELFKEPIESLVDNISNAFYQQLDIWLSGGEGINIENSVNLKADPDRGAMTMLGSGPLGSPNGSNREEIVKRLILLRDKLKKWPESKALGAHLGMITEAQSTLVYELTIWKRRRVLPGKCKSCPF